ncbi:MAG TPA: hypothetical protein VNA68_00175 [Candidatus Dormibacteraeota bacterium]|nr:hypothetical protein [Candidatus Dormibacteraeota bacterium]
MKKLTSSLIYLSLLVPGAAMAFHEGKAHNEAHRGAAEVRPESAPQSLVNSIQQIANVLIFVVGAVAVLVLIIGGLTYVTSAGDPARIKRAKDTILYGVVGVVVAILAYAIIGFVTSNIK